MRNVMRKFRGVRAVEARQVRALAGLDAPHPLVPDVWGGTKLFPI
jgi:hypothetical protein